MAYLAVVSIYRDEASYLREWIEFHRLVGVERFYLYNNVSEDDHREVLAPYVVEGIVEVTDWPLEVPPGDAQALGHCMRQHREDARWIATLDIDEFLFSETGRSVPEVLAQYEEWPAVGVICLKFGTSGHRARPPGLVTESYLHRGSDTLRHEKGWRINSIADPRRVRSEGPNQHYFVYTDGAPVDETKQPIEGSFTPRGSHAQLRINHYWTKSEEECRAKFDRWTANGIPRPWSLFLRNEKLLNGTRDEAITTYLPELRKALARPAGASPTTGRPAP
jgi:hypothetical protein